MIWVCDFFGLIDLLGLLGLLGYQDYFVKFGDSAITGAAYQGHFDIAELLLKSKVFVLLS